MVRIKESRDIFIGRKGEEGKRNKDQVWKEKKLRSSMEGKRN